MLNNSQSEDLVSVFVSQTGLCPNHRCRILPYSNIKMYTINRHVSGFCKNLKKNLIGTKY